MCFFALASKGGEGWMPGAGRGGEGGVEVMGATSPATSPAKWGVAQILGAVMLAQNHYQTSSRFCMQGIPYIQGIYNTYNIAVSFIAAQFCFLNQQT